MLHLERIEVGGRKYDPIELTFDNGIKVATIAEKFNELRLTAFLQYTLGDKELPYVMTAQERYYLLIRYLATQKNTMLGIASSFENYVLTPETPWITSVDIGGFTVNQLTGLQVEVLEEICMNAAHWVIGSMAFQLVKSDIEGMPDLPDTGSRADLSASLKARVNVLKVLSGSVFNEYYQKVQLANEQMTSLVRLGFDNVGITVLGGEGDDPMRFRAAASLTGILSQLERYISNQST